MTKLSIIIPAYNAEPYINKLLDCLNPQITDEVQVIIVDDGSKKPFKTSYKWATVITQKNQGASVARNVGLENSVGEYISFIDADDMVSDKYISTLINKIDAEHFDYCYLSWKCLPGGWQCDVKLKTINDEFPSFNLCVWNRCYRRELIKDIRFNPLKLIAEDAEFIRDAEKVCKKKSFISEYMYYYRSDTPNSLTKRYDKGELNTRRIVYNFNHITPDMDFLIDEVKELNKVAEVIIMTNKNEIPELSRYAMVTTPTPMKGSELRGEETKLFRKIELPLNTQVVIWTDTTFKIGGIETFIYNTVMELKDLYDITVLYRNMNTEQINRLIPFVRVLQNDSKKKIVCDTVIVNRITDEVPNNIEYKQKIQMVHCCKLRPEWKIPKNYDYIVPVSNVVKESYPKEIDEKKCNVIGNFTHIEKPKKILKLISATRLSFEKGEQRMIKLAKILNDNHIPFMWFVFTERPLKEKVDNMFFLSPTLDIQNYIAMCDYLVQLSDSEGFCYSIVEALSLGIPVITTPIPVLDEIGFEENKNGIIVPFDMDKVDINEIYNKEWNFKYNDNNNNKIKQWKKILGNTTPKHDYVYMHKESKGNVSVIVIKPYSDIELGRDCVAGEVRNVSEQRAKVLVGAKVCRYLEV